MSATKSDPSWRLQAPAKHKTSVATCFPSDVCIAYHNGMSSPAKFGVPNIVALTWAILDISELATPSYFLAFASSGDPNNWDLPLL